jgi:hypothetical protein
MNIQDEGLNVLIDFETSDRILVENIKHTLNIDTKNKSFMIDTETHAALLRVLEWYESPKEFNTFKNNLLNMYREYNDIEINHEHRFFE